ncbi:hypothetical protein [Hippea sp. KM1]|uniref:hypothetical protein n=1 Tax=Hippea sp. KM1 TaxID=944481 RepID=UPI0018DD7468|nr:hypothetical protein [Hippea sp. KM1]
MSKVKIAFMDCIEVLKDLAVDRVSSSFSIAKRMLKCCIELCGSFDFRPLVEGVMDGQPSMSVVINIGNEVLKSRDCKSLALLLKRLDEAEELSINQAYRELKGLKNIATISFSHSVFALIERLKPERVFLSVSHPAKEGEILADKLKRAGMDVVLFEDVAYSLVVDRIDAFLVGADAVFDDGIVNKIGSYYLALLSKEHSIPFYVVANRFKFLNNQLRRIYKIVSMPKEEITALPVEVLNVYFEFVPIELVSKVFLGGL